MHTGYRPTTPTSGVMRQGYCKRATRVLEHLGNRVIVFCGKSFVGPPSRRYCDEHSETVKYRGKG